MRASFIVRIWLEDTVEEVGAATWRGQITHVPSGERCYMEDLDDVKELGFPGAGDVADGDPNHQRSKNEDL